MKESEIKTEMALSYEELVQYLQNKYGIPTHAYFRTKTCKSKAPISKTNEGLFIHHIKETEIADLSNPTEAQAAPWEHQLPHNLCYCNYLEHLLLHIHINILRNQTSSLYVIDGLLKHLIPALNHIYRDKPHYDTPGQEWRNQLIAPIIENEEEYKELLKLWIRGIKDYSELNFSLEKVISWEGFAATSLKRPGRLYLEVSCYFNSNF